MKICLLGNNLTNLVLANILDKKRLMLIFYLSFKKIFKNNTRTIAISNENYEFLKKILKLFNNLGWPSEKLKIYSE